MELITFSEGIQSIQTGVADKPASFSPGEASFAPMGESVVRHTDALFGAQSDTAGLLGQIAHISRAGFSPVEFEAMADQTLSSLSNILQRASDHEDALKAALIAAAEVIENLNEDQRLLKQNLSALERI